MIGLLVANTILSATTFLDRTADLGIAHADTAACWVDVNNDGWVDLCAGGFVWINKNGKSFEKRDEVGMVVASDFDNDGYSDLFSWSQLRLYRNLRGRGFEILPLPNLPTSSRGACWGDFNGDGYVDLFIGGFENWETQVTFPSYILQNKQGKSFEITWTSSQFRSRGVTACDYDRDNDLDLYVSNYRLQPNQLWINDSQGKLTDQALTRNALATSEGFGGGHSIGAAWGDFDSDGEIDLFAGNFAHVDSRGDQPKSRFLRNQGIAHKYIFEDKGPSGIPYQESYASPSAGDYDNDGNLDLFFTTVYGVASFGKKNYPILFQNLGGFKFEDRNAGAGIIELGPTYEAAWADFDNDGDLDLASNGRLFVNQTTGSSWVKVHLVGDGKAVNRSAIGAQVRIKLGDKILTRQVEAGTGEGNQNETILHFGLGNHVQTIDLSITWPSGKVQTVPKVHVKSQLRINYR